MTQLPLYVTGNQHKADYLAKLLGIKLDHHKVDLDEIQSVNLDEIVEHKVRQAYAVTGRPVLVEDVGLGFDALDGLPGPFIKFFVAMPDGLDKLCRMLDGFDDRKAEATCTFGYFDGARLELFRGSLRGEIAHAPRGEEGFGWDKIFCPEGYGGRTRAELSPEEDAATYQTLKSMAALRKFLNGDEG